VARIVPLICAIALLAGCGGGGNGGNDEEEAEGTVRDFVTAVNKRDGDAYCDELITDEFREQTTFSSGDNAIESCKRQLAALKGLRIELVRIENTKVAGDRATVTAVLRRSGQQVTQRLRLEREDGDWKLAGGGP
jgi:hypothetical protein